MLKRIVYFSVFFLISCNSGLIKGSQIANSDLEFIQELGLLDDREEILFIQTQSGAFDGFKTSGNFYSTKRLAVYWIDESERTLDFAYYTDIDTIQAIDLSKSLTNASCLEIRRKDSSSFKVYISGDSAIVWQFFNGAVDTWQKSK